MNEQPKLPELDAPTQHLMAMSQELGQLKTDKSYFFMQNSRLEQENKELKEKIAGLESRNRSLETQRDDLRDEQVKWLKKK